MLAGLPKDRAAKLMKDNLALTNEAAMESLIGLVTTMQQTDSLRRQLEQLKAHRQGYLNSIIKKEAELAAPGTDQKKAKLKSEIQQLKNQVTWVTSLIEKKEGELRRLQVERMRLGNP